MTILKKDKKSVDSFIRYGNYSTTKQCFETKFKVLRGVSRDKLEQVIQEVLNKLGI